MNTTVKLYQWDWAIAHVQAYRCQTGLLEQAVDEDLRAAFPARSSVEMRMVNEIGYIKYK